MKMAMTAPVLKYHTNDTVVMSFMIPNSIGAKAPEPTNPLVYLYTASQNDVYVK